MLIASDPEIQNLARAAAEREQFATAMAGKLEPFWVKAPKSGRFRSVPLSKEMMTTLEEHMRRSRPEAFARYAARVPVFFPRA